MDSEIVTTGPGHHGGVAVGLEARAERRLIRPSGSFRHVDFGVYVGQAARTESDRLPLTLALVLDRSGSMAGEKLAIAKRATLAVLDRLGQRDRAALVIFDDQIEVLQVAEAVTADLKARARTALERVEARGSTALHQGWLTGCRAIADDGPAAGGPGLGRCFLLTDGLANVGLTDPERIAAEAAGVRQHARVGTSTFGIGPDYDENLLGPLADAGGGQFHNLRSAGEIVNTFVGELGGLLAVAASQVTLELAAEPGVTLDVVSAYWTNPAAASGAGWSVTLGDLVGGEERHVVVRFGFPPHDGPGERTVRGRLLWTADGVQRATAWQEVRFRYADQATCDAEPREPAVMKWVGLHHADRARREATQLNQRGDLTAARERLRRVAGRLAEYADDDPELRAALDELQAFEPVVAASPLPPMAAKEATYQAYRQSRSQPDHRGSS